MPQNLGDYIYARVRQAITDGLHDNQGLLDEVAKNAGGNINVNLGGGVGSLIKVLTDAVLAGVALDPAGAVALAAASPILGEAEGAAGGLGLGFGIGSFLAQLVYGLSQPVLLPVQYAINRAITEGRIDPATAAAMWAKGIMQPDEAKREAADQGFDPNRVTQLHDLAVTFPDLGALFELKRRGWITDTDINDAMTHAGIQEPFHTYLPKLEQILLSPADIALALLRGNISQPVAYSYGQQLGVSNSDLDILTGNTGEPPGLETMQLMLRRGVMTPDEFEKGVRYSRVRNEYIPFLNAIRTGPPSAEAAIKASVEHYLPKDEAQRIAEIDGLDRQYFDWLWNSWGEPISKTEALTLWNRGLIGPSDVEDALRQGRLKDVWIPQVLELKRSLIPIRQLLAIIQHGIEPPEWGIEHLMDHGYTQQDAAALVSVETSGKAAVHKELAESMIVEMYEARAIERQEAIDDLGQLGWTPEQASFILLLQDAKAALAEQKKAVTSIRHAFLADRIGELDAAAQLTETGIRDSQADLLLKDWRVEKQNRVLSLTPTDIANATAAQAIPWRNAVTRLEQLGYTRNDAGIFLAANKVPVPKDVVLIEPQQ